MIKLIMVQTHTKCGADISKDFGMHIYQCGNNITIVISEKKNR